MENTQQNYGVPVNTKSLLAFIFNQMSRLNTGEIDWQTAEVCLQHFATFSENGGV